MKMRHSQSEGSQRNLGPKVWNEIYLFTLESEAAQNDYSFSSPLDEEVADDGY